MLRRSILVLLLSCSLWTQARADVPQPVRAQHGMVASAERTASQVGVDILKKGGNAVDAAVGVAFALAVTYPEAGNLGGGGFMLIHVAENNTDTSIDYREMAPAAATHDIFLDASGKVIAGEGGPTTGYRAVGIPGTVAGLWMAKQKYGSPALSWGQCIEPARKLAADGYVLSPYLAHLLQQHETVFAPYADSYRILGRNGQAYQAGDVFKQPELAQTLQRLLKGPHDFYRGKTAHLLAQDMQKHHGLITLDDLKHYEAKERPVVRSTYRGYPIVSMGPPSSGGVILIEMLNILEGFDVKQTGSDTAQRYHLLAETMQRAFADRAAYMGDTDVVRVPVAGLMDKGYAAHLRATIDLQQAASSDSIKAGVPPGAESMQTTHFTVVDAQGNCVSNTYTLNDYFGSKVIATGTGVILNDEMDDFASKPGVPNMFSAVFGEKNSVAPHKRPLSAMCPTFVMRPDGSLWMALGSPGGPTIINTVLQVVVHVIDDGMNLQEAVDAPRIHHQWQPDEIYYEPGGLSPLILSALHAMGHHFVDQPRPMGLVEAIMIDPKTQERLGASDRRSASGAAIGY